MTTMVDELLTQVMRLQVLFERCLALSLQQQQMQQRQAKTTLKQDLLLQHAVHGSCC